MKRDEHDKEIKKQTKNNNIYTKTKILRIKCLLLNPRLNLLLNFYTNKIFENPAVQNLFQVIQGLHSVLNCVNLIGCKIIIIIIVIA